MIKFSGGTVTIRGMQVFRTGEWNGRKFTEVDLERMVQNFNDLNGQVIPKGKITHRANQESIAGLASYGDVVRLFREGDNLYADLEKVPQEVANWIREGRFAERSIELWPRFSHDGKVYKDVISAVAFLGHELPAVAGMDPVKLTKEDNKLESSDLLGLTFTIDKEVFKIENPKKKGGDEEMDLKELNSKIEGMSKLIAELLQMKKDAQEEMAKEADAKAKAALQSKVTEYETKLKDQENLKAEFEKMKVSLEKSEKERAEFEKKAKETEIDNFVSKLKSEGRLLPAQEEGLRTVLMNASTTEKAGTFTIKKDGKDEKVELTAFEALKHTYSQMPKQVDTKEHSPAGGEGSSNEGDFSGDDYKTPNGDSFDISGADMHAEAEKYAKEHKVSYEEAVVSISAKFKKEGKPQGVKTEE